MAIGTTIWTYFEGSWREGNTPILGAADHATWLGTLVFDGARAFEGVTPDLDRHCLRVNNSAGVMGLKPTESVDAMTELVADGLKKFSTNAPVYIRPMYWSTEGEATGVLADPESTAFALCLEELAMPDPDAGQTLTTTQFCRPMLTMATVDAKAACLYPNNARMLREAQNKGFYNALVTDIMGNVAETATANIFMVRDGEVFTPIPNGTFLNGITRQRALAIFEQNGQKVNEVTLRLEDFRQADEVFMTGNIGKVNPVLQFEEKRYEHGPVTRRLREMYWDWALSAKG